MLTLGIETSCDETAIGIVRGANKILSNTVTSSIHLHKKFAGVVPEIATRYHVEYIDYVLKKSLDGASVKLRDIDLFAVTNGPGLVGSLLIGISMAKALAFSLNKPLIGVNHLIAHIYAGALSAEEKIRKPFIGLVVSGGHTTIFLVNDFDKFRILGQTRDDAIGESFDKVAKILGLGFPGGPVIEKRALSGNRAYINFPKAIKDSLDFSYSGLKTAVLYYLEAKNAKFDTSLINNIAASFQKAAFDAVIEKAGRACRQNRIRQLVIGGGVSVNSYFRKEIQDKLERYGIQTILPKRGLSLDNGVCTAGLGAYLYKKGHRSNLNLAVEL